MPLHAFIAMPYGTKEGIDFDAVYSELIQPGLQRADLEVFRADHETRAGDIREDMFQELLLADLVVADLSIDNANVWYELGVRHGLRARGVVLIQRSDRPTQPFDVYTERKLRYHLKDGKPDPARLEAERDALAEMARATLASWRGRKISPVYALIAGLPEPEWRNLLFSTDNEFKAAFAAWWRRVELARKARRPGDIMVLAEEAPSYAVELDARRAAGNSLLQLGQFQLALEQYEAALARDPTDRESRRRKTVCLERLGRFDEARLWIQSVLEDLPRDAECWALLGRVEKDAWIDRWRADGRPSAELRQAASEEVGLLREAIGPYRKAFLIDPSHYYSGVNALTLQHLASHLGDPPSGAGFPDAGVPDAGVLDEAGGAVRWACRSALEREPKSYWARVSLAETELLVGDESRTVAAYRAALGAEHDWFALDSSRQTLVLLRDLEFRPAAVNAALAVLDKELARSKPPVQPRRVFLFSGHMIDAKGRTPPRFPPAEEPRAATAIRETLERLDAGAGDLGLCQGACGGDLLFAEALLERGGRVELRLPFAEPAFIEKSVAYPKDETQVPDRWRERFVAVRGNPATTTLVMPDQLGPTPANVNTYARANLWQLYTALAWGLEKVHFICLWNGEGGDGPGGTEHMYEEVKRRNNRHVHWLKTYELWPTGGTK
jgi:tetratricopeptide (TPR) repeat protein